MTTDPGGARRFKRETGSGAKEGPEKEEKRRKPG